GSAGYARLRTLFLQRKKNGGSDPSGSHARSRPTVACDLQRSPQNGASGSGSHRDGGALSHASGGRSSVDRTAALPNPNCRPAHPPVFLRPTGSLPGVALQADPDGSRQGGSLASLLLVRALPFRPISGGRRTGHRTHGVLSGSAPHAGAGGSGRSL